MTISITRMVKKKLLLWLLCFGLSLVVGCAGGGPYHESPDKGLTPEWQQLLGHDCKMPFPPPSEKT